MLSFRFDVTQSLGPNNIHMQWLLRVCLQSRPMSPPVPWNVCWLSHRLLSLDWTRMNSQLLTSYICSSVSCLRKWHHHPCLQLLKPESWELAMFPLSLCHFSHLINHNIWGVTHVSPSSELLTSSRLPNFISFASKIPLIFSPQCLCVSPGIKKDIKRILSTTLWQ